MIKVLVVDDSAFMRKMLADMLDSHEQIEVIAKARNGQQALEKVVSFKPDVVTMDVEMPVMSGIDALKNIMANHPVPVIMVSSVTKDGANTTFEAMSYGAVDFIAKPSGAMSLKMQTVQADLIAKVLAAASVEMPKLTDQKIFSSVVQPNHENKYPIPNGPDVTVAAIGTSTGGPKALHHLLTALPAEFPCPILIVQHMPEGFTKSLAERLNARANITVKEAENGERLKKGVAYLCPGGYHLKVKELGTSVGVLLDQSDPVNGHRPSVDSMLLSLASSSISRVIAVIMTGMGADGKKGLIELKHCKTTAAIAESEKTSVVYGMPKAARETGLVDEVVDLHDIAEVLLKYS
ncbi:protein-glutamate methylesterase/protein-glutamine glutaminase [Salisediminibacterium halotolerans]|uniref:protein-glutamate methylesterase/protein-glutamine glutaminase n=1 Tax=Salisediminibacterium halotolerans TaxID=517425 RepID=UPI000EB25BCA|nr:chemotaxis response regulator protein-glutamate methylesterase [Salisediminibacterium halotolerans]RLJ74200.1 two-component system chemotaxis response regulator CheB [Actinophytocola xinjiangensis]RPE87707.1 two-component system chemotaxis response regulator CheB [Salisediminibacterium halotolerans]TWG35037.1 two-component system chemotaxis response regulator CheB [Salisediminibacterium halotolerans]GEL06676.1 chemotaxis response regulator protein-glutamate methylesterase [Salisediminibacter